jgi:hypothetical protein
MDKQLKWFNVPIMKQFSIIFILKRELTPAFTAWAIYGKQCMQNLRDEDWKSKKFGGKPGSSLY